MIRSTEPGSWLVDLDRRALAIVVITLMTVGVVAVCDALASPQPSGSSATAATKVTLVASPVTQATALTPAAAESAIVVQLATEPGGPQADSNANKPSDSANADPSKAVWPTESVENGVLVVRFGPIETPETTEDDAGDQALDTPDDAAATIEVALVCGKDSPWPCDPLWNVREPAEGFHKNERWAYHRLSFKYHRTNFTYHPKRDFAYRPTRNFTYHPKRDWTYHPRQP